MACEIDYAELHEFRVWAFGMNDTARVRHYVRLIATCQSTLAAPEKNLMGILANAFNFSSDEISEVRRNLTFIRLKHSGSEPTENELSDIVERILSSRSAARQGPN